MKGNKDRKLYINKACPSASEPVIWINKISWVFIIKYIKGLLVMKR